MYHQREKYLQLSFITLGVAVVTSFIAMLNAYYLLVLISFFLIAVSLIAEALFLHLFHRSLESLKQLVRAALIIVLVIFLFIHIIIGL